ncbi:MAG: AmmeMemoRadiSam system protein B [Syntrophobacteraceae bacterium CG2_30_61_12]|nr:MAG: AmmeMemoRadiSam system protein B [Syntrophobacteraceae bacterium CG2_30_61_12]
MDHPKLRHGLELLPIQRSGQDLILLRDRLGYGDKSLILSPDLARVLIAMDGGNSLRDLQGRYTRETGRLLFSEQLRQILHALDEGLFLENDRFNQRVLELVTAFRQDPVRRMQHAGNSYAEDPEQLRRELMSYFAPANGGPGALERAADPRPVVGLVAPHIDPRAGGPCFAHAYRAALEARPPATWIVLGTGHEPVVNHFALTLKDFETPFGMVACDRDLGRKLVAQSPRDLLASEINHQREHTVEFQAVFLAMLQPQARIVPVLCSFGHQEQPTETEFIDAFCALLGRLIAAADYPVGVLASVDLAHVGPRYGAASAPGEAEPARHLSADRRLLEALGRSDAAAFIEQIRAEDNARNVCGVAPLYVLARVLEGRARGQLLDHRHALVDQYGSFVTFAAMVFHPSAGSA